MSMPKMPEDSFEIKISDHSYWPSYVGAHFHDCHEIYFLQRGSIKYFLNDSVYTVNAGDIVIIPPSVLHKTRPNNEESHKRTLLYLGQAVIDEFSDGDPGLHDLFCGMKIIRLSKENSNKVQSVLEQLLLEYQTYSPVNMLVMKALMVLVFITIYRAANEDEVFFAGQDNLIPDRLRLVVHYIGENCSEDINLSTLGSKFYINPVYLSKMFKKYMGLNYSEYLTKLRIQKAAELLYHSKHRIIDVATMCGFNSSNHFCKMFKTVMGISPLKYRQQNPTFYNVRTE